MDNHPFLAIYEFSGLSTTDPLDQTARAQGSGPLADSGLTAITSNANELVFAATGLPASYSGTPTAGAGYALLEQNTGRARAANEAAIASSNRIICRDLWSGSGSNWTAVLATFKP